MDTLPSSLSFVNSIAQNQPDFFEKSAFYLAVLH